MYNNDLQNRRTQPIDQNEKYQNTMEAHGTDLRLCKTDK